LVVVRADVTTSSQATKLQHCIADLTSMVYLSKAALLAAFMRRCTPTSHGCTLPVVPELAGIRQRYCKQMRQAWLHSTKLAETMRD